MTIENLQADLTAAYRAGVKAGLDAAANAIIDIQYDGRKVHDHFAEGASAAYEAVTGLNPARIGATGATAAN